MEYQITELIDVEKNQHLLDSFCDTVGIAAAIIDLDGKVIVGSRWQRICTDYYRVNKLSCRKCIESDTELANQLSKGKKFSLYKCKNGLTDAASPIIIEDEHIANVFVGQFLLEPPDIDFFRQQAQEYGFDVNEFIKALSDVPVLEEEKLPSILNFLTTFAEMVGTMMLDHKRQLNAEHALSESEKKFRTLFETSRDALGFASPDGTIIDVNQSWLDLFGYSYDEIIGSDVRIIYVNPDDRKLFSKKLEKNEYVIDYEMKFLIKANREIDCLVTANVCRDESGNILYYQTITRDITERKRLEEQLQIRERMDSLGTLAGGIAHDFNNLLVGIMGNIDMLRMEEETFTIDQKESLDEAFRSSLRAAKLIREIQSLSRGAVSEITSVDMYDVAKDVFTILNRTTDRLIEKKIEIVSGTCSVTGRADQLHQVLLNLGTNAIHAIEEKGAKHGDYVRITAKEHEILQSDKTGLTGGKYIHIFFEDTGAGMSDEVKRRAFDPLFTTRDRSSQKGQGLGLAMVYNIITRYHDGFIDIETTEGKGTIVHIYLPKAVGDETTETKEKFSVAGGNETILVVEDEEMVMKFVRTSLGKYGYTILTAANGQEGLDVYNDNRDSVDLVLLDLTMPVMSGEMFLEKILEFDPYVKVVLSSGHGEEEMQKHTAAKGYLTKPYSLKDLARTIRSVLDMRR